MRQPPQNSYTPPLSFTTLPHPSHNLQSTLPIRNGLNDIVALLSIYALIFVI